MNMVHKFAPNCSSFGQNSRFKRQGFTYLELVFVIVIISTLVSMMLVRILPAMDEAERAAVLNVEGQLRSSIAVQAAKWVAVSDFTSVRAMQGSNPMDLMLEPPGNYAGALADEAQAPPEHWYFASERQELVYRPGPPHTPRRKMSAERPSFAVRLAFVDVDNNGRFERSADEFHGVRLVRTAGQDWLAGAVNE